MSTLRKLLNIDDKKAFEYTALIDKEGKSTLKRNNNPSVYK